MSEANGLHLKKCFTCSMTCVPSKFMVPCSITTSQASLSFSLSLTHDDIIKLRHFLHYWPFVRGIHRWLVKASEALIFSLICAWTDTWANNRDAVDMRHHAHYDVGPMNFAIWGWLYGKFRGIVDQLISVMTASPGVKMLAKIKMSASMDDAIFLKRIMIKVSSVLTSPSNDILHKNSIFCWD